MLRIIKIFHFVWLLFAPLLALTLYGWAMEKDDFGGILILGWMGTVIYQSVMISSWKEDFDLRDILFDLLIPLAVLLIGYLVSGLELQNVFLSLGAIDLLGLFIALFIYVLITQVFTRNALKELKSGSWFDGCMSGGMVIGVLLFIGAILTMGTYKVLNTIGGGDMLRTTAELIAMVSIVGQFYRRIGKAELNRKKVILLIICIAISTAMAYIFIPMLYFGL